MSTFYRLVDRTGNILGVCDSPEEAMRIVPEVEHWKPVAGSDEDFDGWRPDRSLFEKRPHFTIRAVDA